MEFRILGPLEVLDGPEPVPLGGAKRRAVLALLVLNPNEVVSSERLIDELWGEHPPATAMKTLQVHVSRLRKALAGAGGGELLATRGRGYVLQLDPEQLDAHRFERLLADGRSLLAGGQPERALDALERGLALWRGPPLADLAYEPFAQAELARLEDARLSALEQAVEARLALGRHAEVVGELEGLIGQHPYRERLRAQLMLALYRCERQADALQAYHDARRTLVEELGIEPGERLRELERAVLAQEPDLALPVAPAAEPTPPEELPSGVVTFVLTDIEGSSALWEADPAAMAAALELHDELVETGVTDHGGRLLKTKGEGDSTVSVYRRASDAVAAAVALRELLATADWPAGLRPCVRASVHTGEAYERDGDYFGPALSRAARLRALAETDTTLVSRATAELVWDGLPEGAELVDRGLHALRGLSRPEQVYALRTAARPEDEPGTRKTVTVLFGGIVETGTEPRVADPEARRGAGDRLAGALRAVLESHGATVEAYPGDALMAIFGVPLLHEDDALRAVTAAAELRQLVGEPANGSDGAVGVRLGIGTGEVIVDTPRGGSPRTTGAAVNAAKRLEEAAGPGEILLDESTAALVRGLVDLDRADPSALRLLGLRAGGARAAAARSPLVGRGGQLEALDGVFAAAVDGRSCHLVTVLGVAGVGKSRLVDEFVDGLGEEASVLRGRCLPYGDGITYWPLAEVIRDLGGEAGGAAPSTAAIAAALHDDPRAGSVADILAEAVGVGATGAATSEKISWAARRLFESLARRRPLVVIVDDLQWAEPTFLDLVEHVAELAREAPVVVLCMARPELLDERPGWGGGKHNAATIMLEPLEPGETAELVGNLLSGGALPLEAAERILSTCEGNPLFAEELLALLIEEGLLRRDGDGWALDEREAELPVPPTINALVAARLERLPREESALLARASVEGSVFHAEAVRELAPPGLAPLFDRCIQALARKDVIRPARSSFADDDAYGFRHMVIRDAAYRSLPKQTRAELHQRFAARLERVAGARMHEIEEIVGYHLEQAVRLLEELGALDDTAEDVARRASERLESAGRRALARSDLAAAIQLLDRASALVPRDSARLAGLLPDLGAALIEAGRLGEARHVLDAADRAAAAVGDDVAAAHASVQQEFLLVQRGESAGTRQTAAVVERAIASFEPAGDETGLCRAFRLAAWARWIEGQAEAAAAAWDKASDYARSAGAEHERTEILGWIASSLFFGPEVVTTAIPRCEAILAEVEGNLSARADVLQPLAGLHGMCGRFDTARELLRASSAAYAELGLTLDSAVSHHAAMVELLAGDAVAAERTLREGYAALEEMGDTALLSTTAAFLGQALVAQGREEEAEGLAGLSAELAAGDDLITQVLWRGVSARSLARRGRLDEAERLAGEAVTLAERTDFLNQRAGALIDLAVVQHQGRRGDRGHAASAEAIALYDRKGNAVAAALARAALAAPARV